MFWTNVKTFKIIESAWYFIRTENTHKKDFKRFSLLWAIEISIKNLKKNQKTKNIKPVRNVLGFVRLLITFLPSTKYHTKVSTDRAAPSEVTWRLIMNNQHHEVNTVLPPTGSFCWGAKILRALHFQNTLDLGNSDPMSKTIPPVTELITLLPRNPSTGAQAYTTEQAGSSVHTRLPRGSSYQSVLILPVCMPSMFLSTVNILHSSSLRHKFHHLVPLHIPQGEPGTWTSLAHCPREWCRVSNKLKWTFLRNHFPDRQKCGSSAHPTGSAGEGWERVLNLFNYAVSSISFVSHNGSLHI